MKKVLVLGAGRGQVPLINLFHKYGAHVSVVSPKGNYPGLKLADKICCANVKDTQTVLQYARDEQIMAILTDQLDAGVFTCASIAETLGLKGIGKEKARKFTNKYEMRKAAEALGICVPKSIKLKSLQELKRSKDLKFPLIIKPIDNAASRGVYKVNSYIELEEKFEKSRNYSKDGEVLLEEFIEGQEYVVEAYTSNYEVTNLIVGNREYFKLENIFIPKSTVFIDAPSANLQIEKKVKAINEKIIKGFGLEFGITHGEYLYNEKEDKVYLVEIAARGGGVFISSDLIPLTCGVNVNELLVRHVLGLPNKKIELRQGAAGYFCYLAPEGVVYKIDKTEELENIQGVHKCYFDDIELGLKTKPICDKSSRKGPILVKGANKAECYNAINKVKKTLNIQIQTQQGVEPIIWA